MSVWDISNPSQPVQVGDYDLNTIPHNVFMIGRTAYLSHYVDGIHILDLADPTNPTLFASYDTSTEAGGFAGAWGVHAFTDHGQVYVSDRQNGLWVFQVDCGHMNRFGQGTVGTGGKIPRARFDGASPRIGASNFRLELEGLPADARSVLLISPLQGNATVLGVQLHVDLTLAVGVDFTADRGGHAIVPLPIPNDPNLGGGRVYMQIVTIDPGAATGLSASRGMWTGICQ